MNLFLKYIIFPFGVVAIFFLGCPSESNKPDSASLDSLVVQHDSIKESNIHPLLVDFVVQGCKKRTADLCTGIAPLTLVFSAATTQLPKQAVWDFGDNSTGGYGQVVSHTYDLPGTYDVILSVETTDGTVGEHKIDFVLVEPAGPGTPCSNNEVCTSKQCECNGNCKFPLDTGICLWGCDTQACPFGNVCVDLGRGISGSSEPWRTRLCLPICTSDNDCDRFGFSCRLAPVGTYWRKACLPPLPRFVGEPCRDASGNPDPSLCLGGECLDIGASGYCSGSCELETCPDGTQCAKFVTPPGPTSANPVCLLKCADKACKNDPYLACEELKFEGTLGATVAGPADPVGTMYCTVKRCSTNADCGVNGLCDLELGGFCLPRPSGG